MRERERELPRLGPPLLGASLLGFGLGLGLARLPAWAPAESGALVLGGAGLALLAYLLRPRRIAPEGGGSPALPQEELAEARSALDLLLEQNPTIVYSAPDDGSGRAFYISPNLRGVLGYGAAAAIEDPGWWLRGIHPDDRAAVEATIDARSWPEGRVERRYRFRHGDGGWRWLEDRCHLLPAPPGEVALLVGSLTDVTERMEAEERLGKIARNLPGAVFEYRLAAGGGGRFTYADGALHELCGLRPAQMAAGDEAFFSALHPADAARLRLGRLESSLTGAAWQGEARLRHPERGNIWIELRATPERSEGGADRWYGFLTEITQRKADEARLRRLATTDPLTGLSNRRHFFERGAQELRRAARYRRPLALLMLDIDHFKSVNDRYGHEAGDAVLRDLAERLRAGLRTSDLAGRIGGEEFAVLLPETTAEQAELLAERLRAAIAADPLGPDLGITVSLGVALAVPASEETLDPVLRRADAALYRAKAGGRNQVVLDDSLPAAGGAAKAAGEALVSSLPQPISRRGG